MVSCEARQKATAPRKYPAFPQALGIQNARSRLLLVPRGTSILAIRASEVESDITPSARVKNTTAFRKLSIRTALKLEFSAHHTRAGSPGRRLSVVTTNLSVGGGVTSAAETRPTGIAGKQAVISAALAHTTTDTALMYVSLPFEDGKNVAPQAGRTTAPLGDNARGRHQMTKVEHLK